MVLEFLYSCGSTGKTLIIKILFSVLVKHIAYNTRGRRFFFSLLTGQTEEKNLQAAPKDRGNGFKVINP